MNKAEIDILKSICKDKNFSIFYENEFLSKYCKISNIIKKVIRPPEAGELHLDIAEVENNKHVILNDLSSSSIRVYKEVKWKK